MFLAFLKIGFFGFGGGYVMIPLIRHEIVAVRGWLALEEFVDIIAIAEMTPGPIAVNSATFVGFKQAGIAGALSATAGVITPPVLIMLALTCLFMRACTVPAVQRALGGMRAAVLALIAATAISLGRAVIADYRGVLVAAAMFLGLERTKIHPILLLVLASIAGIVLFGV